MGKGNRFISNGKEQVARVGLGSRQVGPGSTALLAALGILILFLVGALVSALSCGGQSWHPSKDGKSQGRVH